MSLHWARILGPSCLIAGIFLVAWAVAQGAASFYLVLFIPVVTGGSLTFAAGALLVVLGIFLLPLSFTSGQEWEAARVPSIAERPRHRSPGATSESGGVILLGPIPIFFGSFKNPSRAVYWFAVLAGSLVLALAVFLVLFSR